MSTPKVIRKKKRAHPLEKVVEKYYKDEIARLGGISFKFTSPNRRSVTDQVTLINGRVIFAEMKAYGKDLSEKQELFRTVILDNNGEHVTIAGKEGVDAFISYLTSEQSTWDKTIGLIRTATNHFNSRYDHLSGTTSK